MNAEPSFLRFTKDDNNYLDYAKFFRWRDKSGVNHKIETMSTRHLFYTLRMIWNHTMPLEFRIQGCKKYVFCHFYTEDYLKRAIRFISKELNTRKDMPKYHKDQLKWMIETAASIKDAPVVSGLIDSK